jgi:RNA polymerase sigma factor (sigma-70 family)
VPANALAKLTAALAAGNENAVEMFYRQYFPYLYAQAVRATGRDEAFCLDVVQDAVLRIIRTVRTVESEEQFRAWLRLVVRTTAYDQLRAERRRGKREAMIVAVGAVENEEAAFDDSQIDWLKEQLARCDPQLVRIIELRFEKRWTLRRIAEMLGLSIGTIDGRLRRAISDLKTRAAEEFDD